MKYRAAGCGSISAVISSIVLLCLSSIIIIIIIIIIITVIIKSAQMDIENIKSLFPKLRSYQHPIYHEIKQSKSIITCQK